MENYEQKYKEALERAKELSKRESDITTMGYIFPELAESEEEKIRKKLIETFNFYSPAMNSPFLLGIHREDILDWFEKQKDFDKQLEVQYKRGYEDALASLNKANEEAIREIGNEMKLPIIGQRKTDGGIIGKMQELEKPITTAETKPQKFKVKYAGSEYNVLEIRNIDGVKFYGIEDEPNHIDYVKAENCEIISGYGIKENGSPYPTKPAVFSKHITKELGHKEVTKKSEQKWTDEDEENFQQMILKKLWRDKEC